MKFIELTKKSNGESIYINPLYITDIWEHENDTYVGIMNKNSVVIFECPSIILNKIKNITRNRK